MCVAVDRRRDLLKVDGGTLIQASSELRMDNPRILLPVADTNPHLSRTLISNHSHTHTNTDHKPAPNSKKNTH